MAAEGYEKEERPGMERGYQLTIFVQGLTCAPQMLFAHTPICV